jgi:F0F1-type ATP synthase assembly protein I
VIPLVLAAAYPHLALFTGLLVVGLVVGVFGHIIKSKPLIITGILLIGLISAYFEFFVAKVT